MKAFSKALLGFGVLLTLAIIAVTAYAQMRPIHPGATDVLQTQQIQAMRLEIARLQVQLVACHEEVDRLKTQLEGCEKKPIPAVDAKEEKKNQTAKGDNKESGKEPEKKSE